MWQETFTTIVRSLTNDFNPVSPKLTDDQIQIITVIAGGQVSREFPFEYQYTFNYELVQITPDPTVKPDNDAIALWSLKAACIINTNAFQAAVSAGIEVKDGDSFVSTVSGLKSYADLLKLGPCLSYKELVKLLMLRKSMRQGKCVLGPHSNGMQPWGNTSFTGNWQSRAFFDFFLRY